MSAEITTTRERLVETAMRLFWEQGYAATGIAQILKESNTRSGSLYYYFPTKEDLLLAVLEHYKVLLAPMVLDPVYARVSDPIERIFGILDGYRQLLAATNCQKGCPIGNLALEVSDSIPTAAQLAAENFEGWKRAVERCLDDAGTRLPAGTDKRALASFVLTVMEGAVMQAKASKSLEPFETAVAVLRDYFDRLLREGTSRKPAHRARKSAKQRR